VICHELKLVLLHVPRTAGWSMIKSIEAVVGEKRVAYPTGGHHQTLDKHWVPAGYKVAMFVRNPWDRLVSLNHMLNLGKVVTMTNLLDEMERNRDIAGPEANLVWLEPSADRWVHPRVDVVLRFETLAKSWSFLCQNVGLSPNTPLQHQHKTRVRMHYSEYYTEGEAARVARLCPYEVGLGYRFESVVPSGHADHRQRTDGGAGA